jgi:hypothetical protein
MKVTGYQLREAIKRWELRRDTASSQFNESLFVFEAEKKDSPDVLMEIFVQADRAVAQLQTAQNEYNLKITVSGPGFLGGMTLCEAIKRVGGAGRSEKMWRVATSDKGRDRYQSRETSRSKDQEYARRVLSVKETMKRASDAAVFAGNLRAAIAEGNTNTLDIGWLKPDLFE